MQQAIGVARNISPTSTGTSFSPIADSSLESMPSNVFRLNNNQPGTENSTSYASDFHTPPRDKTEFSDSNPFKHLVNATDVRLAHLCYDGETWSRDHHLPYELFIQKVIHPWQCNHLVPWGFMLRKLPQTINDDTLRSLIVEIIQNNLPMRYEFDEEYVSSNLQPILKKIFAITDCSYSFSACSQRFEQTRKTTGSSNLDFFLKLYDIAWPICRTDTIARFRLCKDMFLRKNDSPELVTALMHVSNYDEMISTLVHHDTYTKMKKQNVLTAETSHAESNNQSRDQPQRRKLKCYECNEWGFHLAKNCPRRKSRDSKNTTAEQKTTFACNNIQQFINLTSDIGELSHDEFQSFTAHEPDASFEKRTYTVKSSNQSVDCHFLIDSGSNQTILPWTAIQRLKCKSLETITIRGVNSSQQYKVFDLIIIGPTGNNVATRIASFDGCTAAILGILEQRKLGIRLVFDNEQGTKSTSHAAKPEVADQKPTESPGCGSCDEPNCVDCFAQFCREVETHRNVDLTEQQNDQLIALLKEFRDLFSKKPAIFNDLVFKLEDYVKSGLTDADFREISCSAVYCNARLHGIILKLCYEMVDSGILEIVPPEKLESMILCNIPTLLINKGKKPDGTTKWRLSNDARKLNSLLISAKNSNFIPLESYFSSMRKKYKSVIDVVMAYHHLQNSEFTSRCSGLRLGQTQFRYKRSFLGLSPLPEFWNRNLNLRMSGTKLRFFYDDGGWSDDCFETHLQNLRIAFTRLRELNLKISLSKCKFAAESVDLLGTRFTGDTIVPGAKTIETLHALKGLLPLSPATSKKAIGSMSFIRRYVPNFNQKCEYIHQLSLVKDENATCKKADDQFLEFLRELKDATLSTPDESTTDFVLWTDGSLSGIGGILLACNPEGTVPISYFSKKLSTTQKSWAIFDLEMLAIESGLETNRFVLAGNRCQVFTDCKSLYHALTDQNIPQSISISTASALKNTRRLMRISAFPCELDFKLTPGEGNEFSDLCSRLWGCPDDTREKHATCAATINQSMTIDNCEDVDPIIKMHVLAGHSGVRKTQHLLRLVGNNNFTNHQVEAAIENCECYMNKRGIKEKSHLFVPYYPMFIVHGDFKALGRGGVFAYIDSFSGYAWAEIVKTCSEEEILRTFNTCFRDYKPWGLKLDNFSACQSASKTLDSTQGITHVRQGAYNPQSNLTERLNRMLEWALECEGERFLRENLQSIVECHNNTKSPKLCNETPFKVMYGREPSIFNKEKIPSPVACIKNWNMIRKNIHRHRNNPNFDKNIEKPKPRFSTGTEIKLFKHASKQPTLTKVSRDLGYGVIADGYFYGYHRITKARRKEKGGKSVNAGFGSESREKLTKEKVTSVPSKLPIKSLDHIFLRI